EDALWVASRNSGVYFRASAGAALTQVSGFPESTAWAVVMTPANPASAYVTSTQHVYFTSNATGTDAGVAWTDVTGDLASIGNGDGPGELRAIVYISSPTTGDRIVVAAANAVGSAGTPGVFMMAVN